MDSKALFDELAGRMQADLNLISTERAAATAKLKRIVEKIRPPRVKATEVIHEALDAVVRAWEEGA